MNETKVAVYLTDLETKQFVTFQKHRAFIGLLESTGVFDIRNGSVTIHFDDIGRIGNIEVKKTYRQ